MLNLYVERDVSSAQKGGSLCQHFNTLGNFRKIFHLSKNENMLIYIYI